MYAYVQRHTDYCFFSSLSLYRKNVNKIHEPLTLYSVARYMDITQISTTLCDD